MTGGSAPDEPPAGAPPKDGEPDAAPQPEEPGPTVTCPSCGSAFERRTLKETCRYEPGQGYRCPNCNHILVREAASE
jgi:predicted RNA-binding Zn-ribbon protein involved in translation (DUF1610 family)